MPHKLRTGTNSTSHKPTVFKRELDGRIMYFCVLYKQKLHSCCGQSNEDHANAEGSMGFRKTYFILYYLILHSRGCCMIVNVQHEKSHYKKKINKIQHSYRLTDM